MFYIFIFAFLLVLFIIVNHTSLFHPKSSSDILNLTYSVTQDRWFCQEGNNKLVIFLHGMYSTPKTFEDIAELLNLQGYDVYTPSLPASAYTKEELKSIGPWSWEESLAVAREKIKQAAQNYDFVILGGHSQGGSITMALAPEFDIIKGVIIISSPVNLYHSRFSFVKNLGVYLSGLLYFLFPHGIPYTPVFHEERKSIEKPCDAEGINFPWTIFTFKRGLVKVRKNLHKICAPLFLAYEKGDQIVDFANKDKIKKSVSSSIIKEKVFDTPKHLEPYGLRHQLLNYQMTRDELNNAVLEFISEIDNTN